MPSLWESDHSYYCNEGNYFSNDCGQHFKCWSEFLAAEGDSDMDYDLLFRWDWERPLDDDGEPTDWKHDENYRESTLKLFWIGQRKGLYRFSTVEVCRSDEPSIRAWLESRWSHLKKLWEPLA